VHIPKVPKEIQDQIREALKRPEGTFMFNYTFDGLFDPSLGSGILLEIPTGQILFRLERDSELTLNYYHSSPGTNTRVSTIDLKKLPKSNTIKIFLTWSPEKIGLSVGSKDKLLHSTGVASKKQFRIDGLGDVVQVGDKGIEVMGITVMQGGEKMLDSTAIQTWDETIKSIEFLFKGTSPDGYIFEFICANLAIAILVTGFESYCKRRFQELEDEGIIPNFDEVAKKFIPKIEYDVLTKIIIERAKENNISPIKQLVNENRINFQNYDNCKSAFKKAYGIKFGEDLKMTSMQIEELKNLIKYRHQIVHISPLKAMPNLDTSKGKEIVHPSKKFANNAMDTMNQFIHELHNASLQLRPKN